MSQTQNSYGAAPSSGPPPRPPPHPASDPYLKIVRGSNPKFDIMTPTFFPVAAIATVSWVTL